MRPVGGMPQKAVDELERPPHAPLESRVVDGLSRGVWVFAVVMAPAARIFPTMPPIISCSPNCVVYRLLHTAFAAPLRWTSAAEMTNAWLESAEPPR